MSKNLFKNMKKISPILRELSSNNFSKLSRKELFLICMVFNYTYPKNKITYITKKTNILSNELYHHVDNIFNK